MPTKSNTYKNIIDQRLGEASWNPDNPLQVVQEETILVDAEPGTTYTGRSECKTTVADYIMLGHDLKPIAVLETKYNVADLGQIKKII
jgi:type I site-specific restriction endonuclease